MDGPGCLLEPVPAALSTRVPGRSLANEVMAYFFFLVGLCRWIASAVYEKRHLIISFSAVSLPRGLCQDEADGR